MTRTRAVLATAFTALFLYALQANHHEVEAFEIGRHNVDQLPHGKEADGIVGDFVLRNDGIELLIGADMPGLPWFARRTKDTSTEARS